MSLAIKPLGIGHEDTYGSAGIIKTYTPVRSTSLSIDEGVITLPTLLRQGGNSVSKLSARKIGGSVDFYGYPDDLGHWLKLGFGGVTTALASGEDGVVLYDRDFEDEVFDQEPTGLYKIGDQNIWKTREYSVVGLKSLEADTSGAGENWMLFTEDVPTDGNIVFTGLVKITGANTDEAGFTLRGSIASNQCYTIALTSSNKVKLSRYTNQTETLVQEMTYETIQVGVVYAFKIRANGNNIQAKFWKYATETEPTEWLLDEIDNTFGSSRHYIGCYVNAGSGAAVYFDNLLVVQIPDESAYLHTFEITSPPASATINKYDGQRVQQYIGCTGKGLSLTVSDKILNGSVDLQAITTSTGEDFGYNILVDEDMTSAPTTGDLVGDATFVTSYLRLTQALNSELGILEYEHLLGESFEVTFDLWAGGGGGADAVWFYWGTNQTPAQEDICYNAYCVAFTEYRDKIELYYDVNILTSVTQNNLDNSTWRTAKIVVNGTNIKIYLDDILKIDYTDTARTPAGIRFGWGGRTGGVNNEHRIKNVSLKEVFVPSLEIPFRLSDFNVYMGTSVANALSNDPIPLDEWDFKLSPEIADLANIGERNTTFVRNGKVNVGGTIRRFVDSTQLEDYAINGTEIAVVFDFLGDDIGVTSKYRLQLILPRVVMTKHTRAYTATETIVEELTYQALYDETNSYFVKALLTNLVSEY